MPRFEGDDLTVVFEMFVMLGIIIFIPLIPALCDALSALTSYAPVRSDVRRVGKAC